MARTIVEDPPPLNSFTSFPFRVLPAPIGTFVTGGMLAMVPKSNVPVDAATHFEP